MALLEASGRRGEEEAGEGGGRGKRREGREGEGERVGKGWGERGGREEGEEVDEVREGGGCQQKWAEEKQLVSPGWPRWPDVRPLENAFDSGRRVLEVREHVGIVLLTTSAIRRAALVEHVRTSLQNRCTKIIIFSCSVKGNHPRNHGLVLPVDHFQGTTGEL